MHVTVPITKLHTCSFVYITKLALRIILSQRFAIFIFKVFNYFSDFCCLSNLGSSEERSCEDKFEGTMIKQICLEDYKAAANSALKFLPFRREIVKAVTLEIKREMRSYIKGKSMAKYNGNPLSLKDFRSDDFLLEMSERLPLTHTIVTATSNSHTKTKFLKNKQILAFSALLNTWLKRSNFIYRLNLLLSKGCCKTEIIDLFQTWSRQSPQYYS